MIYEAVELKITEEIVETGQVETYSAANVADAVQSLIYAQSLKNGRFRETCRIGPSGRTVMHGRTGWALIRVD